MNKTLLFLAVAALISFVSIEGFKRTYQPPVVVKEVPVEVIKEVPVIVEKDVIKEVPIKQTLTEDDKKQLKDAFGKIANLKQDESYDGKVDDIADDLEEALDIDIEPPVCPRCGKRHW